MPGEKDEKKTPVKSEQFVNNPAVSSNVDKRSQKYIDVNSLKGRVCYFSLSGDLALKAFEEIKFSTFRRNKKARLKTELVNRLYFAVIMFDIVVMHCSDPLRSELVLNILEENRQWVKSGKVVFIFSSQIKDIRKDYRQYIDKKISDYSDGYYTEKEAESLKQDHITEEYYERVISLLEETPFLIRKPRNQKNSFDKLVLRDLNSQVHHERVIADSQSDISQILSLDLSLHQLLNVRLLNLAKNDSNGEIEFAFPLNVVKEVSTQIDAHLEQGNIIARSAIVDAISEKDPENVSEKQRQNILKAITLRMDVLYCRMNSGKQLILEFHPSYENRSIYQTDCFFEYLSCIAEHDMKDGLRHDIIDKMLQDDHIDQFRQLYLACMADTKECMSLIQTNANDTSQYHEDLVKLFKDIVQSRYSDLTRTQFDSIGKYLRGDA